jgi:hypothetical protein
MYGKDRSLINIRDLMMALLNFANIAVPLDEDSMLLRNKAIRQEMVHTFEGTWDRLGMLLENLEDAFVTSTMDSKKYTDARGLIITRDELVNTYTTTKESKDAMVRRRTTINSSGTPPPKSTIRPPVEDINSSNESEREGSYNNQDEESESETEDDEEGDDGGGKPSVNPPTTSGLARKTTTITSADYSDPTITDLEEKLAYVHSIIDIKNKRINELEKELEYAKMAIATAGRDIVDTTMALEAEKKKAREDENHYLYVVGYLFKTIDQERVRSSFLRQQTKDVNVIEMIKKMGIIDEESDYFSPDFKGTWESVLKASAYTKSFQEAYDKFRGSLSDNLKE